MTELANRALLPAGLRDVLPPEAVFSATVVDRLMRFFGANGYDRVMPPLVEFEDTLLAGSGAATAGQVFRVMDPVSQRMMAVRADITGQAARMAATRLCNAPRPLRLSYAGEVLRVKGSQLRPERQLTQAGLELIGSAQPEADAEVVLLAAEALMDLGVTGVSVDLNLPTLVPAVFAELGLPDSRRAGLRRALDHKDAAWIAGTGGPCAPVFGALLGACGPADRAVAALRALDLPAAAAAERDTLADVVGLLRAEAPHLTLTVDAVEHRGFEYHTGVSFAIFARGAQGELGRGGRYRAGAMMRGEGGGDGPGGAPPHDHGEPAIGATLFVDAVLDVLDRPAQQVRVLLPRGIGRDTARRLQAEGWVTVAGHVPMADADLSAEARRMGCSHVCVGGQPVPVVLR